jgi:hypothetical protein
MSTRGEGHFPILEDQGDYDDIAVTLEPSMNREQHLDDSFSSVSDAPSVDHFNISVRSIIIIMKPLRKIGHIGAKYMYSYPFRPRIIYP